MKNLHQNRGLKRPSSHPRLRKLIYGALPLTAPVLSQETHDPPDAKLHSIAPQKKFANVVDTKRKTC